MTLNLEAHEEIKERLKRAGWSLTALSAELDVAQSTLTTVSQGYRRSRRIEKAIAAKLGTVPEELWPGRYESEEGEP